MASSGNAAIATEFLTMVASGRVREGFGRHVADSFTHHNAWFPGTANRRSLLVAVEQSAGREPNKSFDVKQIVDAGDRVAVLSHLVRAQAGREYAVVHIFRLEDSKIVEMWDVGPGIAEDSPNDLGMF